ncbi:MAG: hypothetical protein H7301_01530 [Cryobacterium sp.]|nr:hypothetical protein [Oligoflexia bacterium]
MNKVSDVIDRVENETQSIRKKGLNRISTVMHQFADRIDELNKNLDLDAPLLERARASSKKRQAAAAAAASVKDAEGHYMKAESQELDAATEKSAASDKESVSSKKKDSKSENAKPNAIQADSVKKDGNSEQSPRAPVNSAAV